MATLLCLLGWGKKGDNVLWENEEKEKMKQNGNEEKEKKRGKKTKDTQ